VDLGGCRLDALVADYEAVHGFAVAGHSLYLSGRCSGCRAAGL
jgi:Fe2+ or Zn2+ uptake regulation protein